MQNEARRAHDRKRYQQPERKAAIHKRVREARERGKRIADIARDRPCLRCGGEFPLCCMEFHHRDRATKHGNVSDMLHLNTDRLIAEIEKCDVVCANCHRILEAERR